MKALITVLAVAMLASCSSEKNRTVDNILDSRFRVYQISGFQGPKIDIKKDSLAQFLIALHYDIQNSNKPNFEATYRELNFDKEVFFEEFFIFWYHWIYTEATDVLIAEDIVQKPQNDMFYYQVAVNF
jgi:hypothetical protein